MGELGMQSSPYSTYQAWGPGRGLDKEHLCFLFKGPRFRLCYQQPQTM